MPPITEILGYLPDDIKTIVALLVVLELTAMASFAFLHRIRDERLPFGASSPALRAIIAWLVALPPVVIFALALYAIIGGLLR